MNCYRHRDRSAVGICAACGKGVCGESCAQDETLGLSCTDACHKQLQLRQRALRASMSSPVGWGWSTLLVVLGVVLLYYGYRFYDFTMSVPNLLGMLFVWYGVVLLLQRVAQRENKP